MKSKGIKLAKKDLKSKIRGVVYLTQIPHGFYEEQMRAYFTQFGKVLRVRVARSRKTLKSKGYAYVEFEEDEVAKIAADSMNNYLMFDKLIKSRYMPPEKVHPNIFFRPQKVTKLISTRVKAIDQQNSLIKPEKHVKIVKNILQKLKKKKLKLQELGISFEFEVKGADSYNETPAKINKASTLEPKKPEILSENTVAPTKVEISAKKRKLATNSLVKAPKLYPKIPTPKSMTKKRRKSTNTPVPTKPNTTPENSTESMCRLSKSENMAKKRKQFTNLPLNTPISSKSESVRKNKQIINGTPKNAKMKSIEENKTTNMLPAQKIKIREGNTVAPTEAEVSTKKMKPATGSLVKVPKLTAKSPTPKSMANRKRQSTNTPVPTKPKTTPGSGTESMLTHYKSENIAKKRKQSTYSPVNTPESMRHNFIIKNRIGNTLISSKSESVGKNKEVISGTPKTPKIKNVGKNDTINKQRSEKKHGSAAKKRKRSLI